MGGTYNCGGSILNSDTILTAAHCAGDLESLYTVHAGSNDLQATTVSHNVTRKIVHEEYRELATGALINDIAIFKVSNRLMMEVDTVVLAYYPIMWINPIFLIAFHYGSNKKRVQDCHLPVSNFQRCLTYVSFVLRFL